MLQVTPYIKSALKDQMIVFLDQDWFYSALVSVQTKLHFLFIFQVFLSEREHRTSRRQTVQHNSGGSTIRRES